MFIAALEFSPRLMSGVFCTFVSMEQEYTHIAEIYGVRCYFNENDNSIKGTNWLNDNLISIFTWIDCTFCINGGFYIKIIRSL